MKKQHYKLGAYHRVADHLYRYSATLKYYAVFKLHGKTKWVSLETTDRKLASRRVREEIEKYKKTDLNHQGSKLNGMKLERTSPSIVPSSPIITHTKMMIRRR